MIRATTTKITRNDLLIEEEDDNKSITMDSETYKRLETFGMYYYLYHYHNNNNNNNKDRVPTYSMNEIINELMDRIGKYEDDKNNAWDKVLLNDDVN